MIDEYRKTLEALFALLEKKQALRREMRSDVVALSDLDKHIGLIQQEIDETQEVLCLLERRERDDGSLRYGYRRRNVGGLPRVINSVSVLGEIAPKTNENETEG